MVYTYSDMQLAQYKCKYCEFESNEKIDFKDHLVAHLEHGTNEQATKKIKRQEMENENKQLKNLIASLDGVDMTPKNYQKYQPLLNRYSMRVVN